MSERHSQADRILQRLKAGPATSWDLQQLGICSHTSRISELRKLGYRIEATDTWRGRQRIVTYTLHSSSETVAPAPSVPLRSQGMFTRWCDGCQKPFQSVRVRKRFCSNTCRARRWKQQNLFIEEPNATSTIRA